MICPNCRTENDVKAARCVQCGVGLVPPTAVFVTVDLSPGTVFHGRYRILGPLGRGGMGSVYKAQDTALNETVAIKILRPDYGQDATMAERFKSEIRLARKVRHRNVCTIHDFGEEQGLLFISMELVEGADLKQLLRGADALSQDEAYGLAIQIAEGLQAVHDAGIIHRDLKTPNVMRDASGQARLMDFGIAKLQGSESLTATGAIIGTPEYMSPEQGQGQRVDFHSDIYSLGIVTYELFTGHTPFRGDTPISTILKHIHEPPPLDGPAAARIPPQVRGVLGRALAKDPSRRYASARDFAEALRQARHPSRHQVPASTDALQAPTVQASIRASPRSSRARLGWAALALVLVGAAGTLLVVGLTNRRSSGPPQTPATLPSPVAASLPGPTAAPTPSAAHSTAPSPPTTAPSPPKGNEATPARPGTARTPAFRALKAPPPSLTAAAPPLPQAATPPAAPLPQAQVVAPDGSLQVVARPWAEVTVDGKLLGETPLDRISLPPGVHSVRLRHPSYEPVERSVTIRSGTGERLVVDFPKEGVKKP
jgi:serine/threonine protein kinase